MTKSKHPVETRLKNITSIGLLLQMHRNTVRRYIQVNNIEPETFGGNPEYDFAKVARAIYSQQVLVSKDPDVMNPDEMNKYFMALSRKLSYQKEAGEACRVSEVRETAAAVIKALSEAIKSFPDVAERDHGASPENLVLIDKLCNILLNQLADELTNSKSIPV